MVAHQQRANSSERCMCDPQQQIKDNRAQVDLTNVYGCAAQHRTIPLPICVTPESLNQHVNCSVPAVNSLNRPSCPIHNRSNYICFNSFFPRILCYLFLFYI